MLQDGQRRRVGDVHHVGSDSRHADREQPRGPPGANRLIPDLAALDRRGSPAQQPATRYAGLRARTNALMNLPSTWGAIASASSPAPARTRGRSPRGRCASAPSRSPRTRPWRACRGTPDSSSAPATQPIHSSTLRRICGRDLAPHHHVGHGEPSARLQARGTPRPAPRSLSADRLITQLEMMTSTDSSGSGICSISPFRNSTFVDAGLPLVLAGQGQHLVRHVEAVGLAGRAHALRPRAGRRCRRPIRGRARSRRA